MIDPSILRRVGQASAVILEMAVTVVLGVAAGAWLDSRFHTTPIFLLLLSVGALVFGMVRLTRALKRFFTDDDGNPRTISLSAALLLLLATPLVAALGGASYAAGFAAAGGLVLVNLGLWIFMGRQAFRAVQGGGRPLLAVLILPLKFLALLGVLALLVQTFPPISVLLGASVVVAALMMLAVVGLRTDLQVGEGHP